MNLEVDTLINSEKIVKFIKSQRIRWLGHIYRMEKTRNTRAITEWKPLESRPRGRLRKRWMECVTEDLRTMGNTRWRIVAENRKE